MSSIHSKDILIVGTIKQKLLNEGLSWSENKCECHNGSPQVMCFIKEPYFTIYLFKVENEDG